MMFRPINASSGEILVGLRRRAARKKLVATDVLLSSGRLGLEAHGNQWHWRVSWNL
jgi:hypothetical protein